MWQMEAIRLWLCERAPLARLQALSLCVDDAMIVLAIDPGETSGWCRVNTTAGSIEGGSFPLWEGLRKPCGDGHKIVIPPDVMVVERFMLYPWIAKRLKWAKLETVEVIGVIKYLAELNEVPVVMQSARAGKSVQLAKKPEGFDKHACDALRHALVFLKREGLLTDELKEWIK